MGRKLRSHQKFPFSWGFGGPFGSIPQTVSRSMQPFSTVYGYVNWVTTGIGDRLRAGIPSRVVISQLGQLSLASLRGR